MNCTSLKVIILFLMLSCSSNHELEIKELEYSYGPIDSRSIFLKKDTFILSGKMSEDFSYNEYYRGNLPSEKFEDITQVILASKIITQSPSDTILLPNIGENVSCLRIIFTNGQEERINQVSLPKSLNDILKKTIEYADRQEKVALKNKYDFKTFDCVMPDLPETVKKNF